MSFIYLVNSLNTHPVLLTFKTNFYVFDPLVWNCSVT